MGTYGQPETEAIVLHTIWDMIDDMVNYEIFAKDHPLTDVVLKFRSMTHMRMFNILVGDFLGQPRRPPPFGLPEPSQNARPADQTHLLYLRSICDAPQLGSEAHLIAEPLSNFADWLEEEATVESVWLSNIELELTIKAQRLRLFKLCGDIAKHSPLRLSQTISGIKNLIASNGHEVDDRKAFLALSNFYEWFHHDFFAYHSSAIAEHLNNLRIGIYAYLEDEYRRSFHEVEPKPMYRFRIPTEIVDPVAKEMYWGVMNKVRGGLFVPQFKVWRYVKLRY